MRLSGRSNFSPFHRGADFLARIPVTARVLSGLSFLPQPRCRGGLIARGRRCNRRVVRQVGLLLRDRFFHHCPLKGPRVQVQFRRFHLLGLQIQFPEKSAVTDAHNDV